MLRSHLLLPVSFLALCLLLSCQENKKSEPAAEPKPTYEKGTYGYDAAFLRKYLKHSIELRDQQGNNKILISPEYQGRVMTSTASGDSGASFGWINYQLISSQKNKAHFNPVGGEERFWLGPEGGQFALYFRKGDSFNLAHWQVPPVLDTIPFELVSADSIQAVFSKQASLTNYSGNPFQLIITRAIHMLDRERVGQQLNVRVPAAIRSVAFESDNQIRNAGQNGWKKESGLLSIWLLGMMTPTDKTVVFIPFKAGARARSLITDNYFGKMAPGRLVVKDSILFFKCDGKSRGKIGLSPLIAGSMAGSFDFEKNVLTVISFTVNHKGRYVNSKWEIQKQPYQGDVINSYNDGPLADGTQLGPFYEIESSSPASELKPGESQAYKQMTCHFQGGYASMRAFAKALLNIDLDELKKM
ncbi:MAG TPA: DUF6786 family protein [Puia sp.]|nr:DUF6786 family protein [Puia sp.]